MNLKSILISLILLLTLSLIINEFYYKKRINDLTNDIYLNKSKEIKKRFDKEVENKFGKTFALTYLLSEDKQLTKALLKDDNSLLNYNKTIKNIQKYGEYKNLWIQIIDKNGYSFYRSWTNKVGDYAAAARVDIVDMIKNPRPMRGISTGRFDMTFKTMIPLYHENEFIGMIEMISKFNSISKIFKSINIEPIMLVHEDYTSRFIKPFTGLFIKNNYVANLDASKELMKKIEKNKLKEFLYIDKYMIFEDYLVTTSQIKDIHGEQMGFFIFFFEENRLDKSIIYNFKTDFFSKIIALLIFIILLILYFINKNYTKLLTKEVAKKTKEIEKRKQKLKALLTIYDKNVIFSRTNKNGTITDVSKAFCDISGFSKDELVGRPHSVVRHPDMPKETFKQMWKTIKQEKIWRGEVKNRKKDGSYYWVSAEIEPEYDINNNLIGYNAVRQNITDAKDIEDMQKEIIFTMGSIGESRSKETGNHVRRVAEYSKILAQKYGLEQSEVELLKQASPMHDIGKVGIPDAILKKPAKLTDEEKTIMNTHAKLGYDMLKNSNRQLLKTAAIVAYEHHEKWDGTGYPNNLKEEEIHIYGRITAIADVFDALGSNRCYKKAWDDDKIFKLFKEERGKHFDPKLVDIFFNNINLFLEVRNKFKD
ncbi:MAG: HD domain-containing phosphohydrolase [Campylobacterota bacterium]